MSIYCQPMICLHVVGKVGLEQAKDSLVKFNFSIFILPLVIS